MRKPSEPKIDKSNPKMWFIFWNHDVPVTLWETYKRKRIRIKVYDNINRFKGAEREEYASKQLEIWKLRLFTLNYNPFEADVEELNTIVQKTADVRKKISKTIEEKITFPTLVEAFKGFLKSRSDRNLEKSTMDAYESFIGRFENYLIKNKKSDIKINKIDSAFVLDCLDYLNKNHKWNASTYNNHVNFWALLLNWFAKKPRHWVKREDFDIGREGEIVKRNSKPMKNQYYGDTVAAKVKQGMKEYPKLLFYSRFIYFSCMRPDEIRNLIVENVDVKGRYIKIVGKTDSRTIPICDELAEMLTELKLADFPSGYYVIGKGGNVCKTMHSENFFAEIFREKIRKPLGLSGNFTLYGWKHTRVVDLLNAGYNDAEIMGLTGHKDTSSYDKYKRELIGNLSSNKLRGKTIGW